MGLDEKLIQTENLFSFRFALHPDLRTTFFRPVLVGPDSYEFVLNPKLYSAVMNGGEGELIRRNICVSLVHSTGYCFNDVLSYGWAKSRPGGFKHDNFYPAYFKTGQGLSDIVVVAAAILSDEPKFICASGIKAFLQSQLNAIFSNVETAVLRLNGENSRLKSQVRVMSAKNLLAGQVVLPQKPSPRSFVSLEDYVANGEGKVMFGDLISGVEITGKQNKTGYGTFSFSYGSSAPITVIVDNSKRGEKADVRIVLQVNRTMYRGEIVKS